MLPASGALISVPPPDAEHEKVLESLLATVKSRVEAEVTAAA